MYERSTYVWEILVVFNKIHIVHMLRGTIKESFLINLNNQRRVSIFRQCNMENHSPGSRKRIVPNEIFNIYSASGIKIFIGI